MMTENATTDKTGIMMIVKNIMIVLTMFALAAILGNGFNLPLFIVLYVLKIALPFPDIILLPIIGIIVFSYLIFIQVKYIKNENFIQALTKLRNLPIVH